ncbi:Spy/CpxP family protein refolding chaperone [Marinobacterium marinum]|uniref:Spy/CpxP family protein refolding chaperone n=1 Tax=Marinobacterium marinum TaxID=2756129 RepID=A0A7W2ADI7_9GAMM|nr:Spy/CpxP family protein refolding chaperone [Marinobacterium marinum]MBA4503592.1 Spy/CpxP family protein refolding chaperone [Marinobacterium marinum]
MHARKTTVSALALCLVAGGSTLAYAGPGAKGDCNSADRAGQRGERMTRYLELDEAQQASVKALFADRAERLKAGPAPSPRAALAGLDPNATDYQQQVQRHISAMQQQLAERIQDRADFKASLYAILTPEQEQKLSQMQERKQHRRHAREGHGRPGDRG